MTRAELKRMVREIASPLSEMCQGALDAVCAAADAATEAKDMGNLRLHEVCHEIIDTAARVRTMGEEAEGLLKACVAELMQGCELDEEEVTSVEATV